GKNARLVLGSRQIASSSERLPFDTSRRPKVALGAMLAESEGFRRSQSTMMARLPLCPISWAREAAIVVLPSFGRADVIPMTWLEAFAGLWSIASLIERIASVNRESGIPITAR